LQLSLVEIAILKGVNDPNLNWDKRIFPFTIAQERHDFLTEDNSYVRAYRIINRDSLAPLTYRQDKNNQPLITLDPSSIDEQEGWTSYIEVNPNAVSGLGILEVDLVPRGLAQKKLLRGQLGR